jgi:hypothetical protein
MKVRIAGNKIRFRLRKQEVATLQESGVLTEVLEFGTAPQDALVFSVQLSDSTEARIDFNAGKTTLLLPRIVAEELSQTDRIGFDYNIMTEKGKDVYVLIEKDFNCLDGSDADNEDTYANPNEQAC